MKRTLFLFLIISLLAGPCLKAKEIPDNNTEKLTSEHVADKTIEHGYLLIDAYIKEWLAKGNSCSNPVFPGGTFTFFLSENTNVRISPACVSGSGPWRNLILVYPPGTEMPPGWPPDPGSGYPTRMIILDGPITEEPGTRNEEVITGAKKDLEEFLSDFGMEVIEIEKSPVSMNIDTQEGIQQFIDAMYQTIELSEPIAHGPIPMEISIDFSQEIVINPLDNDPVKADGKAVPVETIEGQIDFGAERKKVEIKVSANKQLNIETDGILVSTQKTLEIRDSKAYIGTNEIKTSPQAVVEKAKGEKIQTIKSIELESSNNQVTYKVKGTREGKLFFFFKKTINIEAAIDASTGKVTAIKKPWWNFLVR